MSGKVSWQHGLCRVLKRRGLVVAPFKPRNMALVQMLGQHIHDPQGVEGKPASYVGFGLLELETTLQTAKQLTNRKGYLAVQKSISVSGYEIHAGISQGEALESPALYLGGQPDGAISADNQIMATYLHGLFDVPDTNKPAQLGGVRQGRKFRCCSFV